MMYYYGGPGGGHWIGWIWMGFSMIAFSAIIVALVFWAVRSLSHGPGTVQPPSTALNILQERLARGEISPEEFAQKKQLIQGAG